MKAYNLPRPRGPVRAQRRSWNRQIGRARPGTPQPRTLGSHPIANEKVTLHFTATPHPGNTVSRQVTGIHAGEKSARNVVVPASATDARQCASTGTKAAYALGAYLLAKLVL